MDQFIIQDEAKSSPDQMIDQLVKNNTVAVFAKSYCPHSKRVKAFFKDQNIEFEFLDLDMLAEQGKAIQDRLKDLTGQSTVPNVWVNRKFIGGCDSTLKAAEETDLLEQIRKLSQNNLA